MLNNPHLAPPTANKLLISPLNIAPILIMHGSLIHRLRRQARHNLVLPRPTLITNPLPATALRRVFEKFHGREVMLVFLHGRDPGHVVEGHGFEAEVGVVWDFVDGGEEGGKVGGGGAVDGCDEIGGG